MNTDRVAAQPSLIPVAKTDIATAFQSIRSAEQEGASNTDLLPLINQLNQALQLEENATLLQQLNDTTDADSRALQSINLSTNVSTEAQQLGSQAQNTGQRRVVYAYGIAVAIALILAICVVDAPTVGRFIQSRRNARARITYGKRDNAV
jgi:hypothetical protein